MIKVDEVYTSVILSKNRELANELNYLANLKKNLPDTLKETRFEQELQGVLDSAIALARTKIAIPLLGIEKAGELDTEEAVVNFIHGLTCNQLF